MSNRTLLSVIVSFFVLAAILNSFYIVNQTEQALILRFGKPVRTVKEAGLKFKVPFVDNIEMFDRRIVTLNAEPKAVILRDQDRLVVDAFVTYRITDPLQFYQAVGSERVMNQRLENYLETSLREVMGREDLNTLLSPKRSMIMATIRENVARLANGQSLTIRGDSPALKSSSEQAPAEKPRHHHDPFAEYNTEGAAMDHSGMDHSQMNHADHAITPIPAENVPAQVPVKAGEGAAPVEAATSETPINADAPKALSSNSRAGLGIKIVDVRIMRTDLPKQTSDPIYNRMRSDRQKVAERFRAEGARESEIIRSKADKERTILLADAEKESQILRGMGDAKATEIYAKAFNRDPEFYDFYRSMQAYEKSLNKDDTTLILSPDSKFFKYLEQ